MIAETSSVTVGKETNSTAGAVPQPTKQERIRDNQRRSRARRQEYLADLEKRVTECHTTCRDADMQQDAFRELQTENTRLRELLDLAGVDREVVESYVRQNRLLNIHHHEKVSIPSTDRNTTARELRPKLSVAEVDLTPSASASSCMPNSILPFNFDHSGHYMTFSTSSVNSMAVVTDPQLSENKSSGIFEDTDGQDSSFDCKSFHILSQNATHSEEKSTILCNVARDLINQYHIDPVEIEGIKLRLVNGFTESSVPEQGCRIDTQVLFEVLNEISSKYG